MWLEFGVGLLLLFALVQAVVLIRLWRQSQQLQRDVAALSHGMTHVATDVPTSMLVTALGRLERRIGLIEQPPQARQSYELAQQLARDGADVEQLITRCGLSRDEARLVLQMHSLNP
ncbi:MAG TPA: DUF2802 domain-containing protein [Rhodanobacter sp.]|mgnify:FL=1|jgi:hypothetical protein|nr:DUF2802 domain-containing protein [Rhodanobacter sp.]